MDEKHLIGCYTSTSIKPVPQGLSSSTAVAVVQLKELPTLSEFVNTFEVAGYVDLTSDSVWPAEMPLVY